MLRRVFRSIVRRILPHCLWRAPPRAMVVCTALKEHFLRARFSWDAVKPGSLSLFAIELEGRLVRPVRSLMVPRIWHLESFVVIVVLVGIASNLDLPAQGPPPQKSRDDDDTQNKDSYACEHSDEAFICPRNFGSAIG